jgi:flagellar protein FliT
VKVPLKLVESFDYTGALGIQQFGLLKDEFIAALAEENWQQVRVLDQACMALIHKVATSDKAALILALQELKNLYASMIAQCQTKLVALAN